MWNKKSKNLFWPRALDTCYSSTATNQQRKKGKNGVLIFDLRANGARGGE